MQTKVMQESQIRYREGRTLHYALQQDVPTE